MFDRVLISSGPTREPLDPVRYLGNRSSGITGFHLAGVFLRLAREVVFVSGPVCRYPDGVTLEKVETALEMRDAVLRHCGSCQVVIMAAAVSDFRPARYRDSKIKKDSGVPVLELVRNPDILEEVSRQRRSGQIIVGFAAETGRVLENGLTKFRKKHLDLMVLNEVSPRNPAFGPVENRVILVTAERTRSLPALPKADLAAAIAAEVMALATRGAGDSLNG